MSTSLFFLQTDQNSLRNPTEFPRNSGHVVNSSGQIRTEPNKTRGRKPGPKTGQQNQKKQRLRGMGVAQLERLRAEEEKKKMVAAAGDTTSPPCPSGITLSSGPDPVVVLQGYPSYGGGRPTTSIGGGRSNRIYYGGVGSGQIVIDPVCPPWGFVETSSLELSSIPNPQMYNACDTCFKKKRLDGDKNVTGSSGGGFSKYPFNGYDHFLQPEQRSQGGFFYDQRLARSATVSSVSSSTNPYFNDKINHTGSTEELGSYMEGNPRNGAGDVKEYEFFPGRYGETVSVATSVGDYCPNTSTIDLSLKL